MSCRAEGCRQPFPRLRVPLAAGRGEHDVVLRHVRPVRLVQILTGVDGLRVVAGVPLDRLGPMVCSPEDTEPSVFAAARPSTETRKSQSL